MSLRFVFGPAGSGKSEYVQNLFVSEASQNRDTDYLMIVPDQFTLKTQLIMTEKNPSGGILNIDVLSFTRLTHRIFKEVGRPQRIPLNDLGKCLILRRVINEHEADLKILKKGIHTPGYVEEIKSVLSEFMQYGIRPNDLSKDIESMNISPALRYKLKDFSVLYKAFEQALEEKYTTGEEDLYCLMERIPRSGLLKRSVLVFDGFTGFTPLQISVIGTLLEYTKKIIITLPLGLEEFEKSPLGGEKAGIEELFYLTKKTVRDLKHVAGEINVPVEDPVYLPEVHRFANAPSIAYLERNLFRKREADYPDCPKEIHISRAKDEEHECRILLRQMLKLRKERNYRYRDMAVVCGNLEEYKDTLRECFERYEIPYFMDTTKKLTENPFVNYLRALLSVVIDDYSYRDCFILLKSAFSGFDREDVDFLDNYILAKKIRGRGMWQKEFTSLTREMNRSISGLKGEEKTAKRKEILNRLNVLRSRFVSMLDPLQNRKDQKSVTAAEWMRAIYEILTVCEAENKLSVMAEDFSEEGAPEKELEYSQTFEKVMGLFDQVVSLIGEEEISLEELSEVLDTGYGEIRIGTVPMSVEILPVCDLIRSRFGNIKALFFLGMNEGNIPSGGAGGGLLSDLDRSILGDQGMELAPNRAMEGFAEQLYLYQILSKPSEELFISFLCVTETGCSKKPSYFIGELKKLYPALEIRDEVSNLKSVDLKDGQDTLYKHNILSKEDLLREFTDYLGNAVSGILSDEEIGYTEYLYANLKADESMQERLSEICDNAFKKYTSDPLSEELAKSLYGNALECSVSSLERFAGCAYAHFLDYGLNLQERETAEIDSKDLGNVTHNALEAFGKFCQENHEDFAALSVEKTESIIDDITDLLLKEYEEGYLLEIGERPYLAGQMKRILKRSVHLLKNQLKQGDYVPVAFEEQFIRLLSGGDVKLKGRIDRIDVCETDTVSYVKIVDYKSGDKDFEETLFHAGVQLQTVVYLSEAIKKFQKQYPERTFKPGAMFYFRMQDPFLETTLEDQDRIEKERNIKLRPTGIFSKEEENLSHLENNRSEGKSEVIPASYKADLNISKQGGKAAHEESELMDFMKEADESVEKLSGEILSGVIKASPLVYKKYDACKFCKYKTACGFDAKLYGYEKRVPKGEEEASDNYDDDDGDDN